MQEKIERKHTSPSWRYLGISLRNREGWRTWKNMHYSDTTNNVENNRRIYKNLSSWANLPTGIHENIQNEKFFLCTSHCNIQQTPFFLYAFRISLILNTWEKCAASNIDKQPYIVWTFSCLSILTSSDKADPHATPLLSCNNGISDSFACNTHPKFSSKCSNNANNINYYNLKGSSNI